MLASTLIARPFTVDHMFYSNWTPAWCCWGGRESGAQSGRLGCRELRGTAREKITGPGEAQCQFDMEFVAEKKGEENV